MKSLQCLLMFLFICSISQAAHIHGGYITAEVTSVDNATSETRLSVSCVLYREALGGGAPFDNSSEIQFGIYVKNGAGDYQLYEQISNISVSNVTTVFESEGSILIERGEYQFVTIVDQGSDYLISYQRCCRPETISNLIDPGNTGIAIQTELTAAALGEVGAIPRFQSPPITQVRPGHTFVDTFDLSFDMDYTIDIAFVAPRQAGGLFDATGGGPSGCCECIRPDVDLCLPPFDEVVFVNFDSSVPFGSTNNVVLDNNYKGIEGVFQEIGVFQYGIEIVTSKNGVVLSKQLFDYGIYSIETDSVDDGPFGNTILYPNPTQGIIALDQLDIVPTNYELYSIGGELLESNTLSGSTLNLEVEAGTYLLRFTNRKTGQQVEARIVKL